MTTSNVRSSGGKHVRIDPAGGLDIDERTGREPGVQPRGRPRGDHQDGYLRAIGERQRNMIVVGKPVGRNQFEIGGLGHSRRNHDLRIDVLTVRRHFDTREFLSAGTQNQMPPRPTSGNGHAQHVVLAHHGRDARLRHSPRNRHQIDAVLLQHCGLFVRGCEGRHVDDARGGADGLPQSRNLGQSAPATTCPRRVQGRHQRRDVLARQVAGHGATMEDRQRRWTVLRTL